MPAGNTPGGAPGMPGKGGGGMPPGKPKLGGGNAAAAAAAAAAAPGWFCGSIGLAWAWPSAAYDDVMESMTDWAFSWPISAHKLGGRRPKDGRETAAHAYAGSSPPRCADGCARCYAPCARSSSRA